MSFYHQPDSRFDRSKRDQNRNQANEKYWIGNEISLAPSAPQQEAGKTQWIGKKDDVRQGKPQAQTRVTLAQESHIHRTFAIGSKSPIELMQDILKGVREEQVRSFYSHQNEETLAELLTNRFKLNEYIKQLEAEMVGLDSGVVKNYEILVLLLQQVSGADVQARHGSQGLQIRFNRTLVQRQELEIERLEKQKEEREKQMKYIVQEYESIIANFNDVIERLVNKDEARHKQKF